MNIILLLSRNMLCRVFMILVFLVLKTSGAEDTVVGGFSCNITYVFFRIFSNAHVHACTHALVF